MSKETDTPSASDKSTDAMDAKFVPWDNEHPDTLSSATCANTEQLEGARVDIRNFVTNPAWQ